MAMACGSIKQSVHPRERVSARNFHAPISSPSVIPIHYPKAHLSSFFCNPIRLSAVTLLLPKASPNDGFPSPGASDDDGVSLGTMKLPLDIDIQRFDSLLFQWANSLCQGANLPLPMPLKVDKIPGGARLGFITVGDGKTEVLVYIDCLVFPSTEKNSAPIFRATRNGPLKDKAPPGEPRIMKSLLQALQKSVQIARL
ncbi:hypothetical protein RJT34_23722 [Clitoria ternatea]|uniref:DUF7148 domain-containing protein n=1 Tax=Clitoria ternatea TaxID=43366 RepID=A0AAN9FLJ4_CLITE